MKRKQYCFNCGEFLGEYQGFYDDIQCCGKPDCDRELRNEERERQAEAEEMARSDNYERYKR